MSVECLLWDFGNTLCDERSLWRASSEWQEVYRSFDDGVGAAWNRGELDTRGFAAELARRMTLSEAEILAHLNRMELFDFFPFTYDFFRARHLPQAIVTVNPTYFSEVVVPGCALDEVTDAVVVSAEEGTIDKGELCRLALARMPRPCAPERALLLDDKESNLAAWEARGGAGYLYVDDATFRADVAKGIDRLARR